MKIAVDIDEVLADLFSAFLVYYNDLRGTSFKWGETGEGLWWENMDIPRDELLEIFDVYMLSNPEIGLIEGAKEGIKYLKSKGYSLVVVTSRPPHFETITLNWLNYHFENNFDKVCFGEREDGAKVSKGDTCVAEGCEYLLEDQIKYAEDCTLKGIKVVLFNKPWNKREIDGLIRVNSWSEVRDIL